jgi:hypothetical protein
MMLHLLMRNQSMLRMRHLLLLVLLPHNMLRIWVTVIIARTSPLVLLQQLLLLQLLLQLLLLLVGWQGRRWRRIVNRWTGSGSCGSSNQ